MTPILHYNASLKDKARFLRKNSSKAEILLWIALRSRQVSDLRFNRQRMIGNFIVDFYCKEVKLAIEIDDKSHDNKYKYDNERTQYLKSLGITVLRFRNEDVLSNFDGVVEKIKQFIQKI